MFVVKIARQLTDLCEVTGADWIIEEEREEHRDCDWIFNVAQTHPFQSFLPLPHKCGCGVRGELGLCCLC